MGGRLRRVAEAQPALLRVSPGLSVTFLLCISLSGCRGVFPNVTAHKEGF